MVRAMAKTGVSWDRKSDARLGDSLADRTGRASKALAAAAGARSRRNSLPFACGQVIAFQGYKNSAGGSLRCAGARRSSARKDTLAYY